MTRVLVAVLDWGLGHATRCIPIVRMLQEQGCEVFFAGSGRSLELMKAEFPDVTVFTLPGYDPEYPVKGSMAWKMVKQIPKFFGIIRREHELIEKLILDHDISAVISDNRYGCWSSRVYSVLITHQSNILMPRRFGWLAPWVRKITVQRIAKFSVCWIPDDPEQSLAGALTGFPKKSSVQTEFIGHLSRFASKVAVKKKYDVVAIFSGPEPQRTLFEDIVTQQLQKSQLSFFIVRGLPGLNVNTNHGNVANHMVAADLQRLIESANVIIARSGYSTIMDLAVLGKKAILIPTPGQTEQEYLAESLMKNGIAFSMPQHKFDLHTALTASNIYSGFKNTDSKNELLQQAVQKLLTRISENTR